MQPMQRLEPIDEGLQILRRDRARCVGQIHTTRVVVDFRSGADDVGIWGRVSVSMGGKVWEGGVKVLGRG